MKQLASIHLLFYQRRTYFYMGVLGWWSHMLLSYCLFILSRLGAAQYLAFRLRCNWYASALAVFIVGLQRFALLGSVHRLIFRGWKTATLVTCLHVRECDSSISILPERKMNSILSSACCPVNYLCLNILLTMIIIILIFWSEQFILWCAISLMNLLNNNNRIVIFILHFHKLTWSQFIPFKQGEVWRSRFFVYSRFINFDHKLHVVVIILHYVACLTFTSRW